MPDVLGEVGSDRNGSAVDARLHLARKEQLAVVLPGNARERGLRRGALRRSSDQDRSCGAGSSSRSWRSTRERGCLACRVGVSATSSPHRWTKTWECLHPTGRPGVEGQATARPSPRLRHGLARTSRPPRTHRSGRASPASGSPSRSPAATRRRPFASTLRPEDQALQASSQRSERRSGRSTCAGEIGPTLRFDLATDRGLDSVEGHIDYLASIADVLKLP